LKNRDETGTFNGNDKRGKHAPSNKTSVEKVDLVSEDINMFPKMASHYCRKDSRRQFIDCNLTIPKMHDLYLQHLSAKSSENQANLVYTNPVTMRRYREIFVNDFNLSPFHPRKDQCITCETWETLTLEEKTRRQPAKNAHDINRTHVDKFREKTKELCLNDPSRRMATLDLQAVLQLPCGQVSQLYYKQKLVVYNLTFYEIPGGRGQCYL